MLRHFIFIFFFFFERTKRVIIRCAKIKNINNSSILCLFLFFKNDRFIFLCFKKKKKLNVIVAMISV